MARETNRKNGERASYDSHGIQILGLQSAPLPSLPTSSPPHVALTGSAAYEYGSCCRFFRNLGQFLSAPSRRLRATIGVRSIHRC